MQLHFRPGSSYDYTKYQGKTNATAEALFSKTSIVRDYLVLGNRIKDLPVDRFLFANARLGKTGIHNLMAPGAKEIYQDWEDSWGTKERYTNRIRALITDKAAECRGKLIPEMSLMLLEEGLRDQDYLDVICWLFHVHPESREAIKTEAEENAFIKLNYDKVIKLYPFYCYFGILE